MFIYPPLPRPSLTPIPTQTQRNTTTNNNSWSKRREALEVDVLRYRTAVRLARGELRKVNFWDDLAIFLTRWAHNFGGFVLCIWYIHVHFFCVGGERM